MEKRISNWWLITLNENPSERRFICRYQTFFVIVNIRNLSDWYTIQLSDLKSLQKRFSLFERVPHNVSTALDDFLFWKGFFGNHRGKIEKK